MQGVYLKADPTERFAKMVTAREVLERASQYKNGAAENQFDGASRSISGANQAIEKL